MSEYGKFIEVVINKIRKSQWRILSNWSNGTKVIADVWIYKKRTYVELLDDSIDPRTGKKWKSAKEAIEWLTGNKQ